MIQTEKLRMSIDEILNYEYTTSFTGTEYFRDDVMNVIRQLIEKVLPEDKWYEKRPQNLKNDIKNLRTLTRLLKKNNKSGYFINPEYFRNKTGRYYVKGVCSLQKFCAYIRNTLIDRSQYCDLDMVNCCPSILKNLTDLIDIPNTYITKYCEDRDNMMKECMEKMNLDKAIVKNLFIRLMFGGTYGSFLSEMMTEHPEFNADYNIPWLKPLFDELKSIANTLYNDKRFSELKKIVNKKKKDDLFQGIKKDNITGSFLSHLLFTLENFIIHLIKDFMGKKGFVMDVIIFDGGLMRLKTNSNDEAKIIQKTLIKECEQFIYDKTGIKMGLKIKEFDEYYTDEMIYCNDVNDDGETELNGKVFKNSWLYDGVRDDADVAEKLVKLCPDYFKYCKTILYGFNNKTGLWTNDGDQIVKQYVYEYADYFKKYKKDTITGSEYISNESYGRNDKTLKRIPPIVKLLTSDDSWVERTERSSVGKLLFKNGIYDCNTEELSSFDPNIVFYNKIDMDFYEQNDETKKWALKVYDILFKDPFKEKDGQGNYLIQAFYNGLRGNVELKNFYYCLGVTNSCKGTTCNAMEEAFGDFVGTFNGELLAYTNSTQDEAMKMRPFYLARHKRLLFGNEINMKTTLNGNLIKKLSSGGDRLQGRGMRENETNFYLQTTPFLFINDLPKINPYDDAVKDRSKFIEYPFTFVNKQKEECEFNEKPADLDIKKNIKKTWFKVGLQHLILFYGKHLNEELDMEEPDIMKNTMKKWTDDMTIKGQLLQTFILTNNKKDKINKKELSEWRKKVGIDMSDTIFNREMRRLGLSELKSGNNRFWLGIDYIPNDNVEDKEDDNVEDH